MRIKTGFRPHPGGKAGQRGTALMEFLFALPFLFFILILSLNFCKVMLMKQRATMAVRYVAFAEVHRLDVPKSDQISTLFFSGEQAESSQNTQGIGNVAVKAPDQAPESLDGEVRQIDPHYGPILSGFMNGMSGTSGYQVRHTFRPLFARGDYWGKGGQSWFPSLTVSANLAVDSRDWRHSEMSITDLLKKAFSRIF